ncbi:MAG: pseudouridine synthase [Gemmatimonadota bacterium]
MALIKYLANLGYGTRREVMALLEARRVRHDDGRVAREGDTWRHDTLRVDGESLDPAPGAVILLHKPTGYTCSTRDLPPLVYDLLPPRFLRRSPVIAPVGRLDRDTSGLLLLTDDGALNHRLTSPRRHVPKRYHATLASPLRGDEVATFAGGALRLAGESDALAPVEMRTLSPVAVELTLTEGRYHQVRRMFAAVGNHVVTLQRVAMGALELGDLTPGAWRTVSDEERALLTR